MVKAISFLSPPHTPFSSVNKLRTKHPILHLSASSSSPSTSVDNTLPLQSDSADEQAQNSSLSTSGCKACGRQEIEKGCNGEGTMQGGIATVPGFGWWPIKAYRPCPGLVASGGRYRRRGQTMDEVGFGRAEM